MALEILESQTIYTGRVFSLRQDKIRLQNKLVSQIDVVVHHGAVAILPIDKDGYVWFIRQYRPAAQEVLWEIPAGTLEKSEIPEDCAQRELREEIGMGAGQLQKIGAFYLAPGYSTELIHIFLAADLFPDSLEGDADEEIETVRLSIAEVYQLVQQGEIRDAKSLAVLLLAQPFIRNKGWQVL